MDEISISVVIADRSYRLTIKKEEEEIIRKAAKVINERIRSYAGHYAYKDGQDLFAMVALELASHAGELEKNLSGLQHQLQVRLDEIEKLTDPYI